MRLLHVAPFYEPAPGRGGMARAASALCAALARRGHQVTVATARLAREHAAEERRDGVRVLRLDGPRLLANRLLPWAPGLARVLASELPGADLVHLHGHRSGLAWSTRRACRRARMPYLLQPHGTWPRHGQRRLAKLLFDRLAGDRILADAWGLLAVSQAEAHDLPRPARVVPNGVAPVGVAATAARSLGQRLLFVGSDRFRRKRADLLPALVEALPGVQLDVVGRVSAHLRSRLERCGPRIVLHGVLGGDALASAYAAADLLVHPAVGEAFGLTPFEAALHGTPAVVASGHGCGEWFGRAGGCVVPPDDPAALLAAVRARLSDPALGRAEAEAVAGFARRELTWDRAAEGVEAVYREALTARG